MKTQENNDTRGKVSYLSWLKILLLETSKIFTDCEEKFVSAAKCCAYCFIWFHCLSGINYLLHYLKQPLLTGLGNEVESNLVWVKSERRIKYIIILVSYNHV